MRLLLCCVLVKRPAFIPYCGLTCLCVCNTSTQIDLSLSIPFSLPLLLSCLSLALSLSLRPKHIAQRLQHARQEAPQQNRVPLRLMSLPFSLASPSSLMSIPSHVSRYLPLLLSCLSLALCQASPSSLMSLPFSLAFSHSFSLFYSLPFALSPFALSRPPARVVPSCSAERLRAGAAQ